jgi:oxygen-dependent protoporphyrinogen oxidase
MNRIAILGGGIAGLSAAYELELARKKNPDIDWHLYESSNRLGGIVETTRLSTAEGTYILEGGPDGWVSDKPWARDLAIELGLEPDLLFSNDATRKTYIALNNKLQPMPDHMRMMVPEDLATLDDSPLFSPEAKAAYAAEITRAADLKASAPDHDESVADFVLRHFGAEVLEKIGGPLLSGVFGGDVAKLSVRSVMPHFVTMEREHGSLILALQRRKAERGSKPPQPIFTSLRNGMASLTEALIAKLPPERLHLNRSALSLKRQGKLWLLRTSAFAAAARPSENAGRTSKKHFHHILLALPIDAAHNLLEPLDPTAATLIPTDASSAVLATFCWPAETATTFNLPTGFGFLVPQQSSNHHPEADLIHHPELNLSSHSEQSLICHPDPELAEGEGPASRIGESPSATPTESRHNSVISTEGAPLRRSGETPVFGTADKPSAAPNTPNLLAATFTNQKFPHRAPTNARILRAFFGTGSAEHFAATPDTEVAAIALTQLEAILGKLPTPDPTLTTVRRWPRSLPQYEVGHQERLAQLDARIATLGGLTLLGNAYRGVGLPDLIHTSREAAKSLLVP